ncbi:MAG: hypothetical protein J3R72DRAFT_458525 [Linnemannia gamsii]|nr:MAG: hypothetical protein J3R72DRAFT_458525 [Linnemannia gamsii]
MPAYNITFISFQTLYAIITMDPLSKLPVECLERIIHYIASEQTEHRTLAHLCRVNKHISSVALAFLYRDPFHFAHDWWDSRPAVRLSRALLRSFITYTPVVDPPSFVLQLGLDFHPNTKFIAASSVLSPTRLHRLGLVRHLNINPKTFLECVGGRYSGKWVHRPYCAAELEYINRKEFLEMYLIERKDATCRRETQSDQLACYHPNVLYREVIWTLAEHILEQLESLTIPLSDIRRYLQAIGRLGRLEHFHVRIDMIFCCRCCMGPNDEPRTKRKEEVMQQLIQFAKEHVRLFPGRLKTIAIPSSEFWAHKGHECPRDIHQEIYEMLPCTYKPTYIASYNWKEIAPFLDIIDLSRVESVKFIPPNVSHADLLQRCRALKSLNIPLLAEESFDWAVQEMKDAERLAQGSHSRNPSPVAAKIPVHCHPVTSTRLKTPLPRPGFPTHGLVQLTKVTIKECSMPARYLDAMASVFNQSLEDLKIEHFRESHSIQTIHLGQGWAGFSSLCNLELYAPRHRLALDPLLFAQCPSLTNVRITDNTFEYSRQDVVPWLPAQTPQLKCLYLKGWSALAFDLATLASTKELTRLKLSMARTGGLCFIPPPVEDLERSKEIAVHPSIPRPQWTWDWQLPCLVELNLNSEFAYRFEFKMVQGCHSLKTLRLHMRTADGTPTRMISKADLFTRGRTGKDVEVVCRSVRKLYMNGHWVFEDQDVMTQFLAYMFPELYQLDARGWGGEVCVGDFVGLLRNLGSNIKILRTDLAGPLLTEEEEDELNMCRRSSVWMKTKSFLRNRLFCSGVEYVIYKD